MCRTRSGYSVSSGNRTHIEFKPGGASYMNPSMCQQWYSHARFLPTEFWRDGFASVGIEAKFIASIEQSQQRRYVSIPHGMATLQKALGRDARWSRLLPDRGARCGSSPRRFGTSAPRDYRHWTSAARFRAPRCRSPVCRIALSFPNRDRVARATGG